MSSSEMVPVVGLLTPHGSPARPTSTTDQQTADEELHDMALLPYEEQQQQQQQQLVRQDDQQLEAYYEFDSQRQEHPQWIDNMVKVASACNKLVRKNCGLCTVYVDQQVEYEQRQQEQDEGRLGASSNTFMGSLLDVAAQNCQQRSPTERVWQKKPSSLEVDVYRQFLFDEASVGGNHNLEDWMGGCGADTTTTEQPPSSITTTTKQHQQHQTQNTSPSAADGVPLAAAVSEDYDEDMEDDVQSVSLLGGME